MTAKSPLAVVIRSLHFQEDRRDELGEIPESVWPKLLHLMDDSRLTLPVAVRCGESLPPAIRERVEGNLKSNLPRHLQAVADWREIYAALAASGIDFITLKGSSHWPFYCDNAAHRPQYDFDLYCPRESIFEARGVIAGLGYEALYPAGGPATDHLPAMIRKTGYRWSGNYFDPALPLTVELHYRFWDRARESFEVRSADRFWERRTVRDVAGMAVPALHPVDCLSYATWHVLRHLLAGNLRLYHVYELAHFLQRTKDQDSFWGEWKQLSSGRLGVPERISLRLASEWFGCDMHGLVREAISALPEQVNRWFGLFALSPVLALESLNKDELFLHLALVPGWRDRLRIATRRIFPRNVPQMVLDAHTPAPNAGMKMRRAVFRARHIGRRALRHVSALPPVACSAARWWLKR